MRDLATFCKVIWWNYPNVAITFQRSRQWPTSGVTDATCVTVAISDCKGWFAHHVTFPDYHVDHYGMTDAQVATHYADKVLEDLIAYELRTVTVGQAPTDETTPSKQDPSHP